MPPEKLPVPPENPIALYELASDAIFDLAAFFEDELVANEQTLLAVTETSTQGSVSDAPNTSIEATHKKTALLLELQTKAKTTVAHLGATLNQQSFARGSSLTSNTLSLLQSLAGNCGAFCAHTLAPLSNTSASLASTANLNATALSMPGWESSGIGNAKLESSLAHLEKVTGLTAGDLLSGKYRLNDIVGLIIGSLGEGVAALFGFELIGSLVDGLFDGLTSSGSLA